MWKSPKILLWKKEDTPTEEYIEIDHVEGPWTLGTDSMKCGSIVNSARGQEIVTVDGEGLCWVNTLSWKQEVSMSFKLPFCFADSEHPYNDMEEGSATSLQKGSICGPSQSLDISGCRGTSVG